METKINDVKDFAIGTKIEYNDKLYEVVEQKFCDECSIKYICPNNDIGKDDSDNLLDRNKRISIFGECSYIYRKDHKSVVFKEISKTKEKDVYNFPLNTRRGFKVIYYLMRLTQSDMIKVITAIIGVRNSAINEALNKCDKCSNENNYILSSLLRGGYIG